jgi:hypothetical protein
MVRPTFVSGVITAIAFYLVSFVLEVALFGVQKLFRPLPAQAPPAVVVIERVFEPIQELPDNIKIVFHRLTTGP